MKITIVQGAFLPVPPVRGGAVEKLWYGLGLEFARRGVDVTHISKKDSEQLEEEMDGGVFRIRVAGHCWSNFKVISRFFDLLYSLRVLFVLPKADIVITNTFFLPFLVFPANKGRVYVSVHRFPRRQFSFYRKAIRFQCVSEAVADALVSLNPSCKSRTKVIPNYVEDVADISEILSPRVHRENKILFVGRVHPEKGLDLLIEAFGDLPLDVRSGWFLEIVGPYDEASGGGGSGYFNHLRDLAVSLKIPVKWVGSVYDKQRLNDIYRSSALFVYPSVASQGEAFGLAPLEAMAQGVPVVVSDLDCFKEFVVPGVNGWMFKAFGDNPVEELCSSLRCAMDSISSDPYFFSKSALETAERFSLSSISEMFLRDFEEILNS